jgi:hypothetical protein
VGSDPAEDLSRALVESAGTIGIESFGPAHHRTESGGSGQVVDHPVPGRDIPRGQAILEVSVDDGNGLDPTGIGQVDRFADQPFIEEPESAGIGTGGLARTIAAIAVGPVARKSWPRMKRSMPS